MADGPALLDTVALLRDVPEYGLARGQVGVIVDDAGGASVLVEFTDPDGRTLAVLAVDRDQLLALHGIPLAAE